MELVAIEPMNSPLPNENAEPRRGRWYYSRERLVSLMKDCISIAQGGAYTSLGVDGCMNALVFGLSAAVWDHNREYRAISSMVILAGVVQLIAAKKLMDRLANKINVDLIDVPLIFSISFGASTSLCLSYQVAKQVVDFDFFAVNEFTGGIAQLVLGVSVKAASSLPIGAVVAVVTFLVIKSVMAARRNHPAGENRA